MFDVSDCENISVLIDEAFEAVKNSYAPYSDFHVGAAVVGSDGIIFRGCNVENSSYSATNCAERTAVFSGVANGIVKFDAIAIVGGYKDSEPEYCYPCGVCRQVLWEFCKPDEFVIIVAKSRTDYKCMTLDELLPHGFEL